MTHPEPGQRDWRPWLVLALALAAYANAFQGGYQFDDYRVIVDNPAVASVSAWWQDLPGIRPLLKLSYAVTGRLVPETRLFALHATNVALHAINAILLLTVLRQLGAGRRVADAAFIAALLFAAHPVHSEAVTYLSGRSVSLMAMFYLFAILAHLAGRTGLSLVAFLGAMMVRETAITLPLALLLIDRQREPQADWRSLLLRARWHWLLAGLGLLALLMLPYFRHLLEVSFQARPFMDNLITQVGGTLYLMGQLLRPTGLNADPVLPVFSDWSWRWAIQVMLVTVGVIWALWRWLRTGPQSRQGTSLWLAFGLIWFLLHLAPTNSLVPRLDVANERHLYLAAAGLYLALGYAMAGTRRGLALGAGLALALTLATHARNQVYTSEVAYWQDVLRHQPANVRALNNLGYAYDRADMPEAALVCYDRGLSLAPGDFNLYFNRRALCRMHASRLDGHCGKTAFERDAERP
jgi:tetratricopeptide (TPR) repeat protein